METTNPFGARLRELRKARGYSLQRLSELLSPPPAEDGTPRRGVNKSYISDLERGAKPPPSRKQILRICDALECTERERDELYVAAGFVPPRVARAVPFTEIANALGALLSKSKPA